MLSYFCTVDIESFLVISGMPLYYKQACGWWEVNRSSQMLCNINFCAFSVIANLGRSASTVSLAQITSCAICYDIIYHPFAINSQYLKTWGGWQPCRSHRRGSKHKELAALIAERSVPIIQFMSSKAVSSSSSDKPGPLMSCGLHSSPSVRDASAETPSSSASLKETVEKQSKTGQ